ncbi:MAG: transketolase C-terminal domain-containing protein [Rectinemataceae bacterium]
MMIETKVHAKNFVDWARDKPRVVVLSADLTGSTEIAEFQQAYPDRFFSMGVAEQNMVSFAAGLAREGYIPFIHTFAVFIYRQTLSQIVNSVAYSALPVKFFGFLPGITTPGGATHQAIEDVSIMRSIPNMTVLEVGDATEIRTVLDVVYSLPGPVYVRMLRGEVPRLFSPTEPFILNRARVLSDGCDVTLFTSGICTEEALRASSVLAARGIGIRHLHISTHKPFNDPLVDDALKACSGPVITMENHTIIGGLGSEIAERMADLGIGRKLFRIGLMDTFAHGGSKAYLMRKYGLDALSLVRTMESALSVKLDIHEQDLAEVHIQDVHSLAKAEAL